MVVKHIPKKEGNIELFCIAFAFEEVSLKYLIINHKFTGFISYKAQMSYKGMLNYTLPGRVFSYKT
jgi:hypothetical protein